MRPLVLALPLLLSTAASAQEIPCVGGSAALPNVGVFPCENVDLVGHLPLAAFATAASPAPSAHNDIWGWTDPQTGTEYALVGTTNGLGVVDLSTPTAPRLVGKMHTATQPSLWRDVKVYRDHAFVVSEAGSHGMQVFDLTRLRSVTGPPANLTADTRYTGFGSAHNLVINEESGFAYGVGSAPGLGMPVECNARGFHAVNIQDPKNPTFAGCFSDAAVETGPRSPGYTHDAQCVVYAGPDAEHSGKEICFGANEDVVTVFDVTDKGAVEILSKGQYPQAAYTHQGWLTEDQRYFLTNDELDEANGLVSSQRTIVFDVSDLDNPEVAFIYDSGLSSIDHNLYVRGEYAFESNYETGLRILDLQGIESGTLEEVAHFDTYPARDGLSFNGAWSVYPYFESGLVVVNDINRGLFVLRPTSLRPVGKQDGPEQVDAVSLSEPVPNPTSGSTRLTLRVSDSQTVRAELFDVAGRRLRTLYEGVASAGQSVAVTVETDGLPGGVYLVRVSGEAFVTSRRLVVTR